MEGTTSSWGSRNSLTFLTLQEHDDDDDDLSKVTGEVEGEVPAHVSWSYTCTQS